MKALEWTEGRWEYRLQFKWLLTTVLLEQTKIKLLLCQQSTRSRTTTSVPETLLCLKHGLELSAVASYFPRHGLTSPGYPPAKQCTSSKERDPVYSHPSNILPRHTEFLASNQNHRKVKWFAWSHTRDPWLRRSPETQLSHCSVQWARGSQTSFPRYPPSASSLDSPSLTIYLPPLCPCLQMPPSLPRLAPA